MASTNKYGAKDSPIDLVVCMDQSESITPEDFVQMQNFVASVLRVFPDLGPSQNQVSVLAFDDVVDEIFRLDTFYDTQSAIQALEDHLQGGGRTRIDLCVQYSARVGGLRSAAVFPRVLLVVTDGRSSRESDLPAAISASDRAGFLRIAVGVGCAIEESELRYIAGNRVFLVDDFNSLSLITDDVIARILTEIPQERREASTFSGQQPPVGMENFRGVPNPQSLGVGQNSGPIDTCRLCPWDMIDPYGTDPLPEGNEGSVGSEERKNYSNLFSRFKSGKDEKWPPDIKGPDWKLVARQSAGYYFRPFELSVNPDDPAAENYAVLSDLERYRATNSMFTFKLHYPCHNVTNVWMQNNNPAVERTGVCCYKPLVVQDDKLGWSGLKFNGKTALMDGSVSSLTRQSYFAVGAFYDFNGGIPGFLPLQGVTRVELYVLPPRESIVICGKPPEIPGTRKNLDSRALEGTVVTYECQCGLFECSGQCFQDAVCLPNPTRELSREDQLIGVEAGQWVGVPKPGDCIVGATSEVDLKEKRKKKKNNRKSRCWEETQC